MAGFCRGIFTQILHVFSSEIHGSYQSQKILIRVAIKTLIREWKPDADFELVFICFWISEGIKANSGGKKRTRHRLFIRRSLRKTTKKYLIFCYQFYYEEKFTGPHNQNFWRERLTSLILSSRNINPPSTELACPRFLATNPRKVRDKKPDNPTRQSLDIRRRRLMLSHPSIPVLGTCQVK